MQIDFDPAKNAKNIQERGLDFDLARQFDFCTAWVAQDTRRDYPERRFQALGYLGQRLHMLVFTPTPHGIRVISLRRANAREVQRYEQHTRPNNEPRLD